MRESIRNILVEIKKEADIRERLEKEKATIDKGEKVGDVESGKDNTVPDSEMKDNFIDALVDRSSLYSPIGMPLHSHFMYRRESTSAACSIVLRSYLLCEYTSNILSLTCS